MANRERREKCMVADFGLGEGYLISLNIKEKLLQELVNEMKESRNEHRVKAISEMFVALCRCKPKDKPRN